jgi:hypothetical protein
MGWRLYADRSRFVSVPQERLFVLQGHIRKEDGRVYGHDWHVVMETSDFERAWAFCPRPSIVVTETEIRDARSSTWSDGRNPLSRFSS